MPGLVTVGLGLAASCSRSSRARRGAGRSPATLGVFAARRRRCWSRSGSSSTASASPIVEFDLFRNGPYFGASAAGFCLVGCYWAVMFLQPQYLQTALGHSALETGVLMLPVTAPMIVISPLGGRLIALFGVGR